MIILTMSNSVSIEIKSFYKKDWPSNQEYQEKIAPEFFCLTDPTPRAETTSRPRQGWEWGILQLTMSFVFQITRSLCLGNRRSCSNNTTKIYFLTYLSCKLQHVKWALDCNMIKCYYRRLKVIWKIRFYAEFFFFALIDLQKQKETQCQLFHQS